LGLIGQIGAGSPVCLLPTQNGWSQNVELISRAQNARAFIHFVYEVIGNGRAQSFYKHFIIQSICPLGFTIRNKKGKDVNYNYYDDKKLQKAAMPFIVESLYKMLELGINRETVFCFGAGKNLQFIEKLNSEHKVFKEIIPLEHPRFIMQYKSKHKEEYIDKFVILSTGF